MVKIIIDDRERTAIPAYLQELGCRFETKRLDVGDYVISDRCIVERKRGDDFASSIFDKRLFDQVFRLKESYEIVILCLEEYELMFYRYPEYGHIFYGAFASLALLGVCIIPIPNEYSLARLLISLAKKEQEENEHPIVERNNPKKKDLKYRQLFLLQGLMNTGPKKAKELLDMFNTPYNVIENIVKTENTEKKITGGPLKDINGIGIKYILENKKLLLGEGAGSNDV